MFSKILNAITFNRKPKGQYWGVLFAANNHDDTNAQKHSYLSAGIFSTGCGVFGCCSMLCGGFVMCCSGVTDIYASVGVRTWTV